MRPVVLIPNCPEALSGRLLIHTWDAQNFFAPIYNCYSKMIHGLILKSIKDGKKIAGKKECLDSLFSFSKIELSCLMKTESVSGFERYLT